jgi:molybdopterin-dependent oxidoreductase alpha subunit
MKPKTTGGGWAAIWYSLRMASRVGWLRLWNAMRSKNACKTCALGMGGQAGGMRNEIGLWPEVCKKSFQAMVADMQAGITPEFFAKFSLTELQALSSRELEWCGRLQTPVYAGPGDTHYRVVDWDFAMERIAKQLNWSKPDENFFYCSGRSSNEAGFLLQLLSRLYGTNYVNNCSYYCHQASSVALGEALGTGTATVTLEDVEHADLFFLIGGNPASNHPRMMRTLMNLRRRGGHVIVINPIKEVGLVNFSVPSDVRSMLFGSEIASLYVQPHIGGDIALLTGLAKIVLERGAEDRAFLANTENFDAFVEHAKATPWDVIEKKAGVQRKVIEQIADLYCNAKNVVFGWTMGITHHEHGVDNVHAIINVALLRGMVGRPHAGLLPIRGHSNVQGIGSMGVAPSLKEQVFNNLESLLKVKLPTNPGLDTMACMHAADACVPPFVLAAICSAAIRTRNSHTARSADWNSSPISTRRSTPATPGAAAKKR